MALFRQDLGEDCAQVSLKQRPRAVAAAAAHWGQWLSVVSRKRAGIKALLPCYLDLISREGCGVSAFPPPSRQHATGTVVEAEKRHCKF